MRNPIVTVLAATAVLWAASIAAPASAEEVSVSVAFHDLDLTSAAGMATLDKRISAAVEKVCSTAVRRDLWGRAAWEECKAATLADAKRQQAAIAP